MAKLLEEAKLPSVEPHPRDWWTQFEHKSGRRYIKSEIERPPGVDAGGIHPDRHRIPGTRSWQVKSHNIPRITWEFLDSELPILRVTAHAEQRLPLTDPASYDRPRARVTQQSKTITRYSVSFVMSLQNRWTSFDDPDRWIVRFGEDLELYMLPLTTWTEGQGKEPNYIPDYWKDPSNTPDYYKDNDLGPSTRYETIKQITCQSRLHARHRADLPRLLGRHRLHATPDHRPSGAHRPRVAGAPARHLQPDPKDLPMGSPRPHPHRRAGPEDLHKKCDPKQPQRLYKARR